MGIAGRNKELKDHVKDWGVSGGLHLITRCRRETSEQICRGLASALPEVPDVGRGLKRLSRVIEL